MSATASGPLILVTSGLGARFGGIGVVSLGLRRALGSFGPLRVWRHHHTWPRALRVGALVARAALDALLAPPRFLLYEHVDLAVLSSRLPALRSTPYGVFLHGTEVWRELEGDRRRALQAASVRMINSRSSLARARAANPWLGDVAVTWLGSSASPGEASTAREALAVSIGRMEVGEQYKGFDQILQAWSAVKRRLPEATLVMVGDGNDRARLERAAAGLAGVSFTGFLPEARKRKLLARARALLFPSTGEGFGLVAVEAALAGVPVVALAGSVIEEILPVGSVLIPGQAPEAIAAAAIQLLGDGELASRVGGEGAGWAKQHFREEHFVRRVRDVLAPLLGS